MWVKDHRSCVCWWDCRKDRRSGWSGWERTCAGGRCQVRQRNETWHMDDICFRDTKMCNPEPLQLLSHACSRDAMWSCCATLYVLYLWVYCSRLPSVGWMIFSRQPKPVLTLRKITNRQGLKNAKNSNCSSSTGFGPTLTTMTKLFADWPRPFVEPPTCFRVNRAVIFFVALKLSSFSLSYVLTVRNGSVFFLGPCQVLVVQSFALSYRLSEIGSLIEWLPRSFCIYRENPMLRILNSLRSCRDVDVLLHGDSVVQHHVVLSTRWLIMTVCILRRRTIVKLSLDGVRAFPVGPFQASVSPGSTSFVFQKVRAWLHDCFFFFEKNHVSRDWSDVTVVLFELCWNSA